MNQTPKLRHSLIAHTPAVVAAQTPPAPPAAPPQTQLAPPPLSVQQSISPPVPAPPLSPSDPSLYPSRRKRDIPHNLSEEIKLQIVEYTCERIAKGEMLEEICELENMPCPNTFRAWLRADPELTLLYHGSKEDRQEHYARLSQRIAQEPVPTYKDANDNVRFDPAAVADKRLRMNNAHRILHMLTVNERHSSLAPVKATADAAPYNEEKWDPDASCEIVGRLQQSAVNGYRQYHLDTFGEYLTDEQAFEAVSTIFPSYNTDWRGRCSEPPEVLNPKPSNPGVPPPKPLARPS